MKDLFRVGSILLIILSGLVINSCKKDEAPKIIKEKISGQVQKGPYVNGTSITMFELNSSLAQTGNSFTTQITNNKGSFEINNINLTSSYVEFNASGYYYDEVKGDLSVAPLNLFALSDIRDISTVNVNIMTHLEKQRVDYLIKQNKTFTEAKKTAQTEILAIFGFSISGISNSETLDISVNSESNAILLAISVILQGNRSVGDLTELLANISNDIKEDGIVNSATLLSGLRSSSKQLNSATIRTNLEKRYLDLGLTVTIPQFEKYVNGFLAYTGEKPSATTLQPIDVATSSVKFDGTVNPNSLSTTVIFEYGKTTTYSDSISAEQSPVASSSSVNVTKTVTTLLPGTTYHFRVKARNSKGTTFGDDLSFTTLGQIPILTTKEASNLKATTVTLNGTVNANFLNTTVIFKWGKTTNNYSDSIFAIQNPVSGNTIVNVSANITGLTKSTVYYVRAYATNQLARVKGDEITFTTLDGNPVLTTNSATATSATAGTGGGNITNDGGYEIIARGSCISTLVNPTINDIITVNGTGTGSFTSNFTGLTPDTKYYVRAYATNNLGTSYGGQVSFTTDPLNLSDVDGNVYKVARIGDQVWITENLRTTKYSDGSSIPNVTDNLTWANLTTPAYSWYDNDATTFKLVYGGLYNWYAVDTISNGDKNVCPTSWHIPSDTEWQTLNNYLGGGNAAGGKLKETGTLHWLSPNVGATNESGFTARGSGNRSGLLWNGAFLSIRYQWLAWSSTEMSLTDAYFYLTDNLSITFIGYEKKANGYAVRCLKNK